MRVYRVLWHDRNAAADEKGGVLYVPPQGAGRIDNPHQYKVLYVGNTAAGACAEVFNRGDGRIKWTAAMLALRSSPELVRSLAWYELKDERAVCNLDDPNELLAQSLKPSLVVTRDYTQTQAWASRLYAAAQWKGVSWWSFHDARWASIGLWDHSVIKSYGVAPITIHHPALSEAAGILNIQIENPKASRRKPKR